MIELFLWFVCTFSECKAEHITITREALAIASCESGDGFHYGTFDFRARNTRTGDGGAWQFNDKTAVWIFGADHAELLTPATQYRGFLQLWNDGRGWRHWNSSKSCWQQWLTIRNGVAVWIE